MNNDEYVYQPFNTKKRKEKKYFIVSRLIGEMFDRFVPWNSRYAKYNHKQSAELTIELIVSWLWTESTTEPMFTTKMLYSFHFNDQPLEE